MEQPPVLIDTHAHLQDEALAGRLPAVLAAARAAGVEQVVAIGITAADSATVVALAREQPPVFAAVGVQPNHVAAAEPDNWERIVALATAPKVVAIGETGLDRYWDQTPFPQQQEWFDRHLDLARRLDLPVVIHCRNCEADIIAQLQRQPGPTRGVLHSFTGTWEHAQAFLELGLYLSFEGMITFRNASLDPLRAVAARVPADRLLIETDSPYLAPHPLRGRPNEPAHLQHTARRVADERRLSLADLATLTTDNARSLFRLPKTPA